MYMYSMIMSKFRVHQLAQADFFHKYIYIYFYYKVHNQLNIEQLQVSGDNLRIEVKEFSPWSCFQ